MVVQLNISLYRIASFSLPRMVFHCFASLGSVGLSSTGPDESTGSGHDLYVARKKNNFGIIVHKYDTDCAVQAYLHLIPLRYS